MQTVDEETDAGVDVMGPADGWSRTFLSHGPCANSEMES